MTTIELTRGFECRVDDKDVDWLMEHTWYANTATAGLTYAARRTCQMYVRGIVYMHRQIMSAPEGMDVDHISGDTLDNRRSNLRIVTRSRNLMNSSGAVGKGFFLCKQTGRWFTRISFGGKRIMLGRYPSREMALMATVVARGLLLAGTDTRIVSKMTADRVYDEFGAVRAAKVGTKMGTPTTV